MKFSYCYRPQKGCHSSQKYNLSLMIHYSKHPTANVASYHRNRKWKIFASPLTRGMCAQVSLAYLRGIRVDVKVSKLWATTLSTCLIKYNSSEQNGEYGFHTEDCLRLENLKAVPFSTQFNQRKIEFFAPTFVPPSTRPLCLLAPTV